MKKFNKLKKLINVTLEFKILPFTDHKKRVKYTLLSTLFILGKYIYSYINKYK